MYTKYGWKIEKNRYEAGAFLIGANFNTNNEWGNGQKETYVCFYLGKFGFTIGKYHYSVDRP